MVEMADVLMTLKSNCLDIEKLKQMADLEEENTRLEKEQRELVQKLNASVWRLRRRKGWRRWRMAGWEHKMRAPACEGWLRDVYKDRENGLVVLPMTKSSLDVLRFNH